MYTQKQYPWRLHRVWPEGRYTSTSQGPLETEGQRSVHRKLLIYELRKPSGWARLSRESLRNEARGSLVKGNGQTHRLKPGEASSTSGELSCVIRNPGFHKAPERKVALS